MKIIGILFQITKSFFKLSFAHKKISVLILIIAISAIILFIPKNNNTILTQAVEYKNLVKSVSVTGDIEAENQVNLTFQTPESLSYVAVKLGDTVKKGQEIAAINTDKLAATVRQTQQDFIAAKAASEKYYNDNQNITVETYDQKIQRTALDDAQNKAYDQYLKAQYDLNHSVLYSPIDGIVTRMDADTPGENVSPTTIFTVTDPNSLYFRLEVDQADIGKIIKGQQVELSLDAFPNKIFKLKLNKIDFVSHVTSSGGNAYYVKAFFNNDSRLRVGMSGNADIITNTLNNILTVPSTSVIDYSYVYVLSNGKYKKVNVKTGLDNDIDTQIISGLNKGDVVAVDASSVPQNLIKN